jgi:hypothetical protein
LLQQNTQENGKIPAYFLVERAAVLITGFLNFGAPLKPFCVRASKPAQRVARGFAPLPATSQQESSSPTAS